MIFVVQVGRNQHEHICEALDVFAREVMPEFQERDEAQRAAKAARLEPALERALERRSVDEREVPEDYVVDGPGRLTAGRAVSEHVLASTASGEKSFIEVAVGDSKPERP